PSRRRHTSSTRDWSSDVCSSDLMGDKPLAAIRGKPRSSIAVGLGLQQKGKSDAFISAGNTGAVMAASTLLLRLHPGVQRAAIGADRKSVGEGAGGGGGGRPGEES